MYEKFTDRACKVLRFAKQEAQRFNHEYIGTEHILLGLVKEGSGVAANVLKNLDIDLRKIRLEVEKIVLPGNEVMSGANMPQTPRAKRVIEHSIEEARNLNHNYVGTEHLLLALLREQEGVAAQILLNLGLRMEQVRAELLGLLDASYEHPRKRESSGSPDPYADLQDLPTAVIDELKALDVQIEQLTRQKEDAVAIQDFDRAALLRDETNQFKTKWFDTVCEYRKRADYFVCPP